MLTAAAIGLFGIGGLGGVTRLLIGPSLADRIVALDVALLSLMGAIAVHAAHTENPVNLTLLIVVAIVGFTATVSAARFIQFEPSSLGPASVSS